MSRQARLVIAGLPHHVVQRGVNRGAIFIDDDDRRHYLRLLRRACSRHRVSAHAYALMDNHTHLLLTPSDEQGLARAMHAVAYPYVRHFNERHQRIGTLWQGRYRSSPIESRGYLLEVLRYIDLNPVRAALVARPADYWWSSARFHLNRGSDPLTTPHPEFLALGETAERRGASYGEWLARGISNDQLESIRRHIRQERAIGSARFQEMVEKTLGRPATCRNRGRPRRASAKTEA